MRPLLVVLLAFSFSCASQSGNSAAIANALLTTAIVVAAHPEMVVPRSHDEQTQMELDADMNQTPKLAPQSALGPDLFLSSGRDFAPPGTVNCD